MFISKIKETLIKEFISSYDKTLQTILAVAQGLSSVNSWKSMQEKKADYLISSILGKFDRQALKGVLDFSEEIPQTTKNYFFEWVDNKSDAELKKFLFYVTGSPINPKNKKITINMKETAQGLDVSACNFHIDVPPLNEEGNELLFANLDYFCGEHASDVFGFTQR
jgi:hypothetical protein